MKHIGFTGTQYGMSPLQQEQVRVFLRAELDAVLHHGDCIGADAQAHNIAHRLGIPIILHPPINQSRRAFSDYAIEIKPSKDYLSRNHDIVDECEVLLACPKHEWEELRSGTWATIRYARKVGRLTHIFLPREKIPE